MMTRNDVGAWLQTLPDDALIGIDDGGLTLREVGSLAYLEVGGLLSGDPGDDFEDGRKFLNYYRCPRCNKKWTDTWTAMCDDDCPHCGARHISPYKSEDDETS